MEDDWRNGPTEDVAEEEEEENGEAGGGLKSRSRKNRLLEKDVGTEGDGGVDEHVNGLPKDAVEEKVAEENREPDGGVKSWSLKNRLLVKEGETEEDAGVDERVIDLTEDAVKEEEEVLEENGEASGGLKSRFRMDRLLQEEGQIEGDEGVDEQVNGPRKHTPEEEVAEENGEAGGGLKWRSRNNSLLNKEGENEGDEGLDVRTKGLTEDALDEEENGDEGGGLKSRARKNRLLETEPQIEGGAGLDRQVADEHARSVYLDQEQGIRSSTGNNIAEPQKTDKLITDEKMQNHEIEYLPEHAGGSSLIEKHHHYHHHHKDLKIPNQPIPKEKCGRMLTGEEAINKYGHVTMPDESKAAAEMDLERILEEQETHDLYCPNCHSCITRRVILRKRKRTAREIVSDAKREKIESVQAAVIVGPSAAEHSGESHDSEPDVFRCLSCLSFFIPTDGGFRLFKFFGKREENENVRSSHQATGRNQSWMSSFFELMKRKNKESGLEQPLLGESHDRYGDEVNSLLRKEKQITSAAAMSEAIMPGKPGSGAQMEQKDVNEKNGAGNRISYERNDTASPERGVMIPENLHEIIEENVKDAEVEDQDEKENSQISLRPEPEFFKEVFMGTGKKMTDETARDVPYKGKELGTSSFQNPQLQLQKHIPDEIKYAAVPSESVDGSIGGRREDGEKDSVKYIQNVPNQGISLSLKNKIEGAENLHASKEGDLIISMPEGTTDTILENYLQGPSKIDSSLKIPVAPSLQVQVGEQTMAEDMIQVVEQTTAEDITHVVEQTATEAIIQVGEQTTSEYITNVGVQTTTEARIQVEQTTAEARPARQWDVLKAIIFGGLLESIASLGVISSAAGSDVTTLNVVALGLANLVVGLLVLIHSLFELKNEQYKATDSDKAETDRYWEALGRRGYFQLHFTVALVSYILVGILPPILYGFSFRGSDNKEYKLIVVAGASLLCIALLAIGKVFVQEGQKSYAKTLIYYIGLGFGASGLSYAVGVLIKKLLEKLNLFDDNVLASTSLSSILKVTSRTPSWQSY